MATPIQIEWLNQNSLRNYPIEENRRKRPDGGSSGYFLDSLSLPNDFLVDFTFSIPAESAFNMFLSRLSLVGSSVILSFSIGNVEVASVEIDVSAHTSYSGYRIYGKGEYEGCNGYVVIGTFETLRSIYPDGYYSFSESETKLETRCIRPSLRHIRSMSTYDPMTGYVTKKLFGNIKLVAGSNIRFRYESGTNTIWIDADSDAYNESCDCDGKRRVVKSINGVSLANVQIVGDDCVSVSTSNNKIVISDSCSKPCCGCAELDLVNGKLKDLETAIASINVYASNLDEKINTFRQNYIASDRCEYGVVN